MASHDNLVDAAAEAIEALTGFINTSTLLDLALRFSATYSDLARTSTDHFLVTPVTALPKGKEKGMFLSIDLGGTNLRVGFVELLGDLEHVSGANQEGSDGKDVFAKVRRSHDRNWSIGDHSKMDKAEDLFCWIADCIAEVVKEAIEAKTIPSVSEMPSEDEILLGITFSFPMSQIILSEATLLPMGKGFAITSNLNLGKLLLAGYARHCTDSTFNNQHGSDKKPPHPPLPHIRVAAITNDTVATFVSLAYAVHSKPSSRVAMGLIVGTGTNATVPMPPSRLHASKKAHLSDSAAHTVVINTEWTIRGTDAPLVAMDIKTRWDATLDAASDAPGFQPFEYMTAGRYLGEIVRLVYVDVEGGNVPTSLHVKNALPTRFLSEVVARLDLQRTTEELEERYPGGRGSTAYWTNERVALLKRVAEAVQRRSSALIAAACVGLLHCVGDICIDDVVEGREALSNGANVEELVIAYAGGTISQYPQWLETCQAWIDKLVTAGLGANAAKRVVLREALDGGIIGAAVLASMTGDIA